MTINYMAGSSADCKKYKEVLKMGMGINVNGSTSAAAISAGSALQGDSTGNDDELNALRSQINDLKQQLQKVNTNKKLTDDEKAA